MLDNLRHDLFTYSNILKTSPEMLHNVLRNLAAGKQNINMTHKIHRLEEIEKNYISSSNRITVGVVAGTSLLAGSWILASDSQSFPVFVPFIEQRIPLPTLLGLFGYVLATVLGVWLAFNILFRSK
jgi:hypothetical protein